MAITRKGGSKSVKKVFFFPDIHWSDRDSVALSVAEAAHSWFKPAITIVQGDLINCDPFARHARSRVDEDEGYALKEGELDPACRFLDRVQKNSGKTVFIAGNHEAWVERWAAGVGNRAGPALMSMIDPRQVFSKGRERFTWVDYTGRNGLYWLSPFLVVTHGWSACRHAAAKHLEKAGGVSVIYAHTHRVEQHESCDLRGRRVTAACSGCLCQKTPKYRHGGDPSGWAHGFGVAFVGHSGFTYYNIGISGGCAVLPDGTEIRA